MHRVSASLFRQKVRPLTFPWFDFRPKFAFITEATTHRPKPRCFAERYGFAIHVREKAPELPPLSSKILPRIRNIRFLSGGSFLTQLTTVPPSVEGSLSVPPAVSLSLAVKVRCYASTVCDNQELSPNQYPRACVVGLLLDTRSIFVSLSPCFSMGLCYALPVTGGRRGFLLFL